MNLQNSLKIFLVILAAVYFSAPLSFANEIDAEQVAAESKLYVEGGSITIGQNRGAARVAADGGTHCSRLKKLDYSVSAPVVLEDSNSRSVTAK